MLNIALLSPTLATKQVSPTINITIAHDPLLSGIPLLYESVAIFKKYLSADSNPFIIAYFGFQGKSDSFTTN